MQRERVRIVPHLRVAAPAAPTKCPLLLPHGHVRRLPQLSATFAASACFACSEFEVEARERSRELERSFQEM